MARRVHKKVWVKKVIRVSKGAERVLMDAAGSLDFLILTRAILAVIGKAMVRAGWWYELGYWTRGEVRFSSGLNDRELSGRRICQIEDRRSWKLA